MRNYVWQYELGWGVFCADTDRLLAWSEFHADAVAQSEMINSWNGPSFMPAPSRYFNPEVITQ